MGSSCGTLTSLHEGGVGQKLSSPDTTIEAYLLPPDLDAQSLADSTAPGDQLFDVEAMGDGIGALPVRREAHGRVVGQGGCVVGADGCVDMPQPSGLRRCQ